MTSTTEFDNAGWQRELRKLPGLKYCEFPKNTEIEIGGSYDQATITMTLKGLRANMQTDAAAFEAWALTLLCHLRVRSIKIRLGSAAARGDGGHYQRFLYRLERFCEFFPNGEVVAPPANDKAKALDPAIVRVLNVPGPGRPILQSNESEVRLRAVVDSDPNRISESVLEDALETSSEFKKYFKLDKVMPHWPVGLFEGSVKTGNRIFPGGSSSIDLVGIRDDTLVVFELKTGRNRKVGGVSELLFYASVMRDAIGRAPSFKFKSEGAIENCAISPRDIIGCSKINAVLLAPQLHRLILQPKLLAGLNEALARPVGRRISFEAVILNIPKTIDEDFSFDPVTN
jgi:hypothetical protein